MSKYIDFVLARIYVMILGLSITIIGILSPNEALNRMAKAAKEMDK